ncbi:hypothetical protein HWV62_44023 [Athelia sp. TMB]|nr:hypothetical protein HWV62_44023 [Athelia sp. TMB]
MPAIISYHGGALVVGDRTPVGDQNTDWMIEMANEKGIICIFPDYRLLHPSNGAHQLEDVRSLFRFLSADVNSHLPHGATLDASHIAVAGTSAGAYLARLAAVYAEPKPVALFSLYGMGGDWLLDHYITIKSTPVSFVGVMLPEEAVTHLLDPAPSPIAEDGITIHPETGEWVDSLGRMVLFPWFLQTGTYVDYVSGNTGLSETLRALPYSRRAAAIPSNTVDCFPQLRIDAQFPPSVFIHGDADTFVPVDESNHTHTQLQEAGVESELLLVPGGEHGLQADPVNNIYIPSAHHYFERAFNFLAKHLIRA